MADEGGDADVDIVVFDHVSKTKTIASDGSKGKELEGVSTAVAGAQDARAKGGERGIRVDVRNVIEGDSISLLKGKLIHSPQMTIDTTCNLAEVHRIDVTLGGILDKLILFGPRETRSNGGVCEGNTHLL